MIEKEIVIIGAGASGLMAATKYKMRDLAIIERNPSIGAKVKVSGGGRCNVTNRDLSARHFLGDEAFVEAILRRFDQRDLLAFLKSRGVEPLLQKRHQYFCARGSKEMIRLFERELESVPLYRSRTVSKVTRERGKFRIDTDKERFFAHKVVVATGGLSFANLGATSLAFDVAASFGLEVRPTAPALVGLTLQPEQFWMKELSGLSLPVAITVEKRRIEGDLLFTHRGISGPAVLDASLYWSKGAIMVDFLPHLVFGRLPRRSKRQLSSLLGVPKRFVKAWLSSVGAEDRPLHTYTQKEWDLLEGMKRYRFAPAGNFGYARAEVTRGGVATSEIDPKTMEAKRVPGLYFLGEALDVTGRLGGYNLQWAFSSAMALRL